MTDTQLQTEAPTQGVEQTSDPGAMIKTCHCTSAMSHDNRLHCVLETPVSAVVGWGLLSPAGNGRGKRGTAALTVLPTKNAAVAPIVDPIESAAKPTKRPKTYPPPSCSTTGQQGTRRRLPSGACFHPAVHRHKNSHEEYKYKCSKALGSHLL